MPDYTVIYFDGMGRGEIIRLILAAAGLEFIDDRIPMYGAEYKHKTLFGHLPVLVLPDGVSKLSETCTIARYLAGKHNLAPKDSFDNAQASMILEVLNDAYFKLPFFETNEEEKKKKTDKVFEDVITHALTAIAKIKKGNAKFMFGNDLTYGDLAVYYFCDCMKKFKKDCLNGSVLETVLNNVAADARVKKWLEKRPKCDF